MKRETSTDDEEHGSDFIPDRSNKTTEEDVLRQEASYVDGLNFKEVGELMEGLDLGIPQSVDDGKQTLKRLLYSGRRRELHSQKMSNVVQKTIEKYMDFKKLLIDQYSKIKDLVEKDMFVKEMKDVMNKGFPEFDMELEKRRKYVMNCSDEFEIVVIGETSTGKSTFLNTLLGNDYLPSHILHTTSCLCRLHNGVEPRLEFTVGKGSATKISIRNVDDLKKELTKQIKSIDQHDKSLAVIDIYWPIPWLQENVVLVDTPGIGERETLTMEVTKYLPSAAGYILIVGSDRGGGIQEGGIVKLLEVIKLSEEKDGTEITDLSNLLFVCNKWDTVEKKYKSDVSEDTRNKLKKYCGPLESWQTVKFSATIEQWLRKLEANPTKNFEILVGSLEKLMIRTIYRRLGETFKWIFDFVSFLRRSVDTRAESLSMSEKDLEEKLRKAKISLGDSTCQLRNFKDVETLINTKGDELVNGLQLYLNDSTVISEISDWSQGAPKFFDLKKEGPRRIQTRLRDAILEWAYTSPGSVKSASDLVEERCRETESAISSILNGIHMVDFSFLQEETISSKLRFKQVTVMLKIIFFPFLLIKSCMLDFSTKIMSRVTVRALNLISTQTLDELISCSFREPWHKQLKELKTKMENNISFFHEELKKQELDRERKSDVKQILMVLTKEVEQSFQCLKDFEQSMQSTN